MSTKKSLLGFVVVLLVVLCGTPMLVHGAELERRSFERLDLVYPDTVHLTAAGTAPVPVVLEIKDGWHVNSHDPIQDYLIPTELRLESSGLKLTQVDYPPGESFNFSFSKTRVLVYSGRVQLPATVSVSDPDKLETGVNKIQVLLQYQACSDRKCAAPRREQFTVDLMYTPNSDQGKDTAATAFGRGGLEEYTAGTSGVNRVRSAFREYGLVLGLGFVFFLGLMLNLTPCVYPMLPVTVGYFGGKESGRLSRRILDALMFVLGMAMIYTIFGTVAGMTETILGQALQQPFVLVVLSGIMVLLAASMFGFYELRVPSSVRRGSERISRGLGTLGMGMTLGVAAAPCLAPATVSLLAFISQQQDAYMGGLLFFVLSLGLGSPYVVLAVFVSSLSDLPGSGDWLEWMNKLIGFMILGVAVYFLWPLMSLKLFGYLLIALAVLSGIVLAVIHPPSSSNLYYARGLLIAALVVIFIVYADQTFLVAYEGVDWVPVQEVLTPESRINTEKPTLVYVSADWCAPCHEMKIQTFPDNTLRRELQSVVPVKVDLTNAPPESVSEWLAARDVKGVPTIVFLGSDGREITSLRTTGFIGPSLLTEKVRILKQRTRLSTESF